MLQPIDAIPISLYIHFPWCIKKCPYCDFNSHSVKTDIPQQQYYEALLADFATQKHLLQNRQFSSIFIGGGTPSLMEPHCLAKLLKHIQSFCLDSLEVTLEANPGTFEQGKFADFLAAGVNRLSIGVQSFNNDHLTALGRIHNCKQAITAVEHAHTIGFENINIDLMYALPNQTAAQAKADLQQAIALTPSHISYYQLTLEANTYFHRYPPSLPSNDLSSTMGEQGQTMLLHASYPQYEVSAYSKLPCKHNLNYWQFGDYLGIGAGAHGKVTLANKIIRTIKPKQPQQYMQQIAEISDHRNEDKLNQQYSYTNNQHTKQVPNTELAFEFMLNALRLTKGFSIDLFEQRTGIQFKQLDKKIKQATLQGLLMVENRTIKPTQRGKLFLNDLQAIFL